jgi:RimJ/RimL family protein N-acetyltransferase
MKPQIREITQQDAPAFARLLIQLSRETRFNLLTEAENTALAETQPARTAQLIASPEQQVLLATSDDAVIGFVALSQGVFERNRHACSLMTGVLREYWRQGMATALMEKALQWAEQRGVTRVELTVMEGNSAAKRFYERFGFATEGVKRQALMVDGAPVDEICMARLGQSVEVKRGQYPFSSFIIFRKGY